MRKLVIGFLLLALPAAAQTPKPPPPQTRSMILAYQQLGLSLEAVMAYYEARIADLERRCGDPCKDEQKQ